MLVPSLARQRLYTSVGTYGRLAADVALGRVNAGDEVSRLEQDLARSVGVQEVLACHMGRIGIYLALKSAIQPGRTKVILSPFTIFDVVNMVVCAGGQPVFADVVLPSCTVDPDEVERLLDDDTAAILVTHTHAFVQDLDRIVELAHAKGAKVVEDAAVAFGCEHQGRAIGTIGDAGVYSFGLFKNISAIFGGAVATRDPQMMQRMRGENDTFAPVAPSSLLKRMWFGLQIDLATHPLLFRAATYWVFRMGLLHDIEWINKRTRNDPDPFLREELPDNLRIKMSSTQARLIRSQLDNVPGHLHKRIAFARYYADALAGIDGLQTADADDSGASGFLVFPIWVDDRQALLTHMMREGRDCPSHYYRDTSQLDCFGAFGRDMPQARRAAGNVVILPTYPWYTMREAEKNVASIRRFFGA